MRQARLTQLFDDGRLEEQIDLNGDGQYDVTSVCYPIIQSEGATEEENPASENLTCRYESVMIRKDLDLNFDGEIDRVRHYEDGALMRIVNDGDFDGHFEWTDYYQGGTLVLTELDPDADGAVEIYKVYRSGRIYRIRRDTDGDNRIDQWEYFTESGEIDKVGFDLDGDGRMDVRRQ